MVHVGFEPSAVLGAHRKLGDNWKLLSWQLSGKMGGAGRRAGTGNGDGNGNGASHDNGHGHGHGKGRASDGQVRGLQAWSPSADVLGPDGRLRIL
jgi:hypothetical protein